jgi:hypothetical protein
VIDITQKANTMWNKVQRADGPLAIFLVKTPEGPAFRTTLVNKADMYRRALAAQNTLMVGVYDLRAKVEWIQEDMEHTLKEAQ